MNNQSYAPFCLATLVSHKAMDSLIESSGQGSYRDTHPWLVALDLLTQARGQNLTLPILFACMNEDKSCEFSHWSEISDIDVVELHRGQWESRCQFGQLHAFNAIWGQIDSVFVKPSAEQLERERRENIRVFRTALDEHHIHPYAICETPTFISENLS